MQRDGVKARPTNSSRSGRSRITRVVPLQLPAKSHGTVPGFVLASWGELVTFFLTLVLSMTHHADPE